MKKKRNIGQPAADHSYDLFDRKEDVYRRHDFAIGDRNLRYPLSPISFSDLTRWDGHWLRHMNYEHIAVEMVLVGSIKYTDGTHEIIAEKGDVFLIVPHSNVKIVNAVPGEARRKLALLISGNAPALICQTLGLTGDVCIKSKDPDRIEKKLREIGDLIKKRDPGKASDAAYSLLRLLADEKQQEKKEELPTEILELREFLTRNLASSFSIAQMALRLGCSPSTLLRRFKKYFSVSPQAYLGSLRLEQAQMLLRTTAMPVKEIAFQCGFASPLYFGQAFRKKFRTSPSAFRKNARSPHS